MARVMNIFIDTEFNDYKGALISMALVDENGREWYEVLECAYPTPWVLANVIPKLGQDPISRAAMQKSLQEFLLGYDAIDVVADWPEDIQHFLRGADHWAWNAHRDSAADDGDTSRHQCR